MDKLTDRASSSKDVAMAMELKKKHVQRYSRARVEIERFIQISINEPRRMLSISTDAMDNKKVEILYYMDPIDHEFNVFNE